MNEIPERLHLCIKPTPLDQISNTILCKIYESFQPLKGEKQNLQKQNPKLSIKRDDLNHSLMGGNKIRKVEFYLKKAQRLRDQTKKEVVLISPGPEQSNHLRTVAVAAVSTGMKSHLVVRTPNGLPPKDFEANFFLMKLTNSEMTFVTPEGYSQKNEKMKEIANKLEESGSIPLIIPEGASGALGCWGYIDAFREILEQDSTVSQIIVAVGSGGTLAGLLLGREIYKKPHVSIVGVPICDSCEHFSSEVNRLVSEFNQEFNTSYQVNPVLWDGYIGEAGKGYKQELDVIRGLFQSTGILLDVKYAGKAFYGLMDRLSTFSSSDHIVFIHTGGIFSAYSYKQELLQ